MGPLLDQDFLPAVHVISFSSASPQRERDHGTPNIKATIKGFIINTGIIYFFSAKKAFVIVCLWWRIKRGMLKHLIRRWERWVGGHSVSKSGSSVSRVPRCERKIMLALHFSYFATRWPADAAWDWHVSVAALRRSVLNWASCTHTTSTITTPHCVDLLS